MFDIEYRGGNCVVVKTKKIDLVVDPNLSVVGSKNIPVKEGIEMATEARFMVNDPSAKLHIEGPGEYEIADVSIRGIRATRHIDTELDEPVSTIYRLEIGDIRIAILGNIAPKLSEDQLEQIGVVDILILPVGGNGYTLDAVSATTITRQIDPKVVIPIHYADKALHYEVPQDDAERFEKELTAQVEDTGTKYKLKSASSIPQVLTLVKLARS